MNKAKRESDQNQDEIRAKTDDHLIESSRVVSKSGRRLTCVFSYQEMEFRLT